MIMNIPAKGESRTPIKSPLLRRDKEWILIPAVNELTEHDTTRSKLFRRRENNLTHSVWLVTMRGTAIMVRFGQDPSLSDCVKTPFMVRRPSPRMSGVTDQAF